MNKLKVFLLLFPLFCLFAALYGIVHDQISYTVSVEYYTRFKFIQFRIPPVIQNRIGAGLVGVYATWWMGLLMGIVLIPLGLIIPGWRNYRRGMIRAVAGAALTALAIGLGALLVGYLTYSPSVVYFSIPAGVENPARFYLCGNMHNFSYLGGLIGILTGAVIIIRERFAVKKKGGPY